MVNMSMFTSDKEHLQKILNEVASGEIQLPDFQRGWIWDDLHIRSLIASISLSYPIGAIMFLENGNPDIRFKPRLIEGVNLSDSIEPKRYILDGQQRLTSLFQSLIMNAPVATRDAKGKNIKRWYYIKITDALKTDIDREEAILSLPEDKKLRTFRGDVYEDYSTPELEYQNDLFPLTCVFSSYNWRKGYNNYWQHKEEKSDLFDKFEGEIIERFKQYLIPIIIMSDQTPKEAVCQVFEKVNTGGISLNVFELITATFAADEFNLREDWESRQKKLNEQKILRSVSATDFLQAVTLLATYARKKENPESAISCKRADVLKLRLDEYKAWADFTMNGFIKAAKLLFQQKIFSDKDLPYGTQLVPLATLFAIMGDKADNDVIRGKITRWYWCGVFGELYGSTVETRFARDIIEVLSWVDNGTEPSTVTECNFAVSRLYSMRTRNSAAYKGLYALLIRDGCLDFRTGEPIDVQTYFDDNIDVHHIFPIEYCRKIGIDSQYYQSIINKTPLSARTNRIIGGKAPSEYSRKLTQNTGISDERLNEILNSHAIDIDAIREDNFIRFFDERRETLLIRIEKATGKRITRQSEDTITDELRGEVELEIAEEEDEG